MIKADHPVIISAMETWANSGDLRRWIERSLERRENILAVSNQGTVLLFEGDGAQLIVKTAMGRGAALKVRQKTLLREYQAYLRMDGLRGVPACHGMLDGQYLLIEYIRGVPYREAQWQDRDAWFAALYQVLVSFHERGVSHGDLKSKSNIMVTAEEQPAVIDFGTAFVHKEGFHPINNRLFEFGRRMDINAWVKHKYHGDYSAASEEDRQLLNYSLTEAVVRKMRGRDLPRA